MLRCASAFQFRRQRWQRDGIMQRPSSTQSCGDLVGRNDGGKSFHDLTGRQPFVVTQEPSITAGIVGLLTSSDPAAIPSVVAVQGVDAIERMRGRGRWSDICQERIEGRPARVDIDAACAVEMEVFVPWVRAANAHPFPNAVLAGIGAFVRIRAGHVAPPRQRVQERLSAVARCRRSFHFSVRLERICQPLRVSVGR